MIEPARRLRLRPCMAALLLWLLAAPAFALGLGQIVVKSQPGQPLVAEIPIVSSEPGELEGLQVRLASPDTFRRVGLQPPQGIVSDLQFEPALDERGQPVVRVTSRQPVQQAELSFLVEVDWGQGRLVREYSALVDTPRSVAAPLPPPIQAPEQASVSTASGVIERPAEPVAEAPAQETEPPPVAAQSPAPAPPPAAPPPQSVPAPPAEPVAPASATAPPSAIAGETGEAGEYGPVRSGETLARIAAGLPGAGGYSLDQTMVALLRANPDAFIGADINRLRQGAVLRVPAGDEISRNSAAEAAVVVRDQVANWRQARGATQVQVTDTPAQASVPTAATPARPAAAPSRRVADARLEIAPPRADAATRAGSQSGASADGEGEMLRQELQQTKENLAARDAEVQELKAKVAELEQLQQQQQSLIAMKDDALAGAQQRMAQRQAAQPEPDAAVPEPRDGGIAWWWLVAVALLFAALGAWLARRRKAVAAAAPIADGERVSDAFAADAAARVPAPAEVTDAASGKGNDAAATPARRSTPAPVWVGKGKPAAPVAPAPVDQPVGGSPTWVGAPSAGVDAISPLNQAPAGRDRIELARAYADLGDRSTARSLLQEVIASGDDRARDEAARLLQGLG